MTWIRIIWEVEEEIKNVLNGDDQVGANSDDSQAHVRIYDEMGEEVK